MQLLQEVADDGHLLGVGREVACLQRILGGFIVLIRLCDEVLDLRDLRRRERGRRTSRRSRGRWWRQADKLLVEEAPAIWTHHETQVNLWRPYLAGALS